MYRHRKFAGGNQVIIKTKTLDLNTREKLNRHTMADNSA